MHAYIAQTLAPYGRYTCEAPFEVRHCTAVERQRCASLAEHGLHPAPLNAHRPTPLRCSPRAEPATADGGTTARPAPDEVAAQLARLELELEEGALAAGAHASQLEAIF